MKKEDSERNMDQIQHNENLYVEKAQAIDELLDYIELLQKCTVKSIQQIDYAFEWLWIEVTNACV